MPNAIRSPRRGRCANLASVSSRSKGKLKEAKLKFISHKICSFQTLNGNTSECATGFRPRYSLVFSCSQRRDIPAITKKQNSSKFWRENTQPLKRKSDPRDAESQFRPTANFSLQGSKRWMQPKEYPNSRTFWREVVTKPPVEGLTKRKKGEREKFINQKFYSFQVRTISSSALQPKLRPVANPSFPCRQRLDFDWPAKRKSCRKLSQGSLEPWQEERGKEKTTAGKSQSSQGGICWSLHQAPKGQEAAHAKTRCP